MTLRVPLLILALVASSGMPARAQPAGASPDTAVMIDALRPSTSRSARNLIVRPAADPAAAPPAASASAPAAAPVALAAASAASAGGATAGAEPVAVAAAPPAAAASAVPAAPAATAVPPVAAVSTPTPPPAQSPSSTPPPSLSLAIQFEVNSARVRPESGPVLGNLVAALLSPELRDSRFAIEGHTDGSGPPARNLALSRDRAEEVRLYLVALGVHPARLKAVGKGASEPANPLDPLAAENRRVRVVTLE